MTGRVGKYVDTDYRIPYYVHVSRVVCSQRVDFGDRAQSEARVWCSRRGRWLLVRPVRVVRVVIYLLVKQVRADGAATSGVRRP